MIELIPNNSERIRVVATKEDANSGRIIAAPGLTLTARIAAAKDSTVAIGTLTVSMTEFVDTPGSYTAEFLGSAITSQLVPTYMDQTVYIQILQGSTISGYLEAVVRAVRFLS